MADRQLARVRRAKRALRGRNRMARAIAIAILLGGAGAALPAPVRAADAVWTGAVSDDWAEAGNWVVPPAAGSFVLIDALAPNATHLRGTASVGAATVGGQSQGELVVEAGAHLDVLGSQPAADPYGTPLGLVVADAPGSHGSVRVEGAGATLVAEQNTLVGNGGSADFSVSAGGTAELGLNTAYAETVVGFGYYAWGDSREGIGHVAVDGAGSTLTYAGGMNILNGTVDVTNGGRMASVVRAADGSTTFWVDAIGFGLPAGADGSFAELSGAADVTVRGAGSAWNSVGALNLGWGGDGTLAVGDGAAASFEGFVSLGAKALLFDQTGHSTGRTRAGTGALTVSGAGSSFTVTGDPNGGAGNLTIGLDGAGSARIDAGATAAIDGAVFVGDGAAGTLDIASGGSMGVAGGDMTDMGMAVGMSIGNQAAGTGTVTVSGADSYLSVDQAVQVGNDGTGELRILDGATAELAMHGVYAEVGVGSGYAFGAAGAGVGHVTVDGAGSTLTHAGGFNVLDGTLQVGNGGRIVSVSRAEDYDLAPRWVDEVGADLSDGGNVAIATVTGAGSAWTSRNALQVAYGGTGTLNVLDGASAEFAGFAVLGNRSRVFGPDGHWTGSYVFGNATLLVSGADSSFALGASESGGGTLAVGSYGTGKMTVADDASATLAGFAVVGGYAGSTGSLAIDSGGTMMVNGSNANGGGLIVGDVAGSTGNITVSGTGSLLAVKAGTQIGSSGTGSLSVLQGGTASLGLDTAYSEIVMGLGYYGWGADVASGRGTLLVDGAGSTAAYSGGLNVLAGAVTVSNGGQLDSFHRVADGDTTWVDLIGFGVPANPNPDAGFDGLRGASSVTITGEGSKWNSVNALDIGDGGDGSLSVLAGATATFGDIVRVGGRSYLYDAIGGSPVPGVAPQAGTGAITVSGAGSKLAAHRIAIVGDRANATGTLAVAAGGAATVDGYDGNGIGFFVGNEARSTGAVTVDGSGSTLTVAAGAQIGNAGTGSLSVSHGGVASIGLDHANSEVLLGFGYYGWGANAGQGNGAITVDGADSKLEYAGGLNVLEGDVTITGGGRIAGVDRASDDAFWVDAIGFGVPANPDPDAGFAGLRGTGTVVVSGAGSAWTSVNALTLGTGGDGVLEVLDGGQASFTGYAEAGQASYLYDAIGGNPVPGLAPQSGSGRIVVSGEGSSFALSAIAGNTTWGTGMLTLGRGGTGAVTVNDGGALSAAGGIKVGALGTVTIGGMQDGALAAPGTIAAPSIALVDPAATLVFEHSATAHDATAYAFAPVVSGNGHIAVASGFTRFTGDSSAFAGTTDIDTGATLSVNGSLGGDISVDGRLQGTGSVGNVTVNDGGTLAPGNSPGTLRVDGDLVMQTGSVYEAEIDSDTGLADSVSVAGDVTIQSGTVLSVTNLGTQPLSPGANLQLIQTVGDTSTVQGQFDSVVGGSELLDFGVSYENGQIQVSAERSATTTFASVAGAGFGSLGVALDGIPDDSALTKLVFTQVTTAAAAAALVDDMAGTMHADLRRVMLEDSRYPRLAIGERLRDDDASGGVAWARAMGGSASADGNGALPGTTVDHSGVMVGYDAAVGDSRLGIAIGTDKGSYATDGKGATAHLYDRHVALYGHSLLGGLRLGYGLAFGATDAKTERGFDIGSARQQLHAKHEARTTQGFVDLGYRLDGGNSFRYVEPFLNLARVQVKDDATTEEGSVAALEIAAGDTSATFGTIGLRWSADMGGAGFAGSIGWRHAFGFDGATATQSFVAGGPSFTIDSLPVDNAVIVDLGARFRMSDRARVWLGYNGMLSGSAHDNGLKLQFNIDL